MERAQLVGLRELEWRRKKSEWSLNGLAWRDGEKRRKAAGTRSAHLDSATQPVEQHAVFKGHAATCLRQATAGARSSVSSSGTRERSVSRGGASSSSSASRAPPVAGTPGVQRSGSRAPTRRSVRSRSAPRASAVPGNTRCRQLQQAQILLQQQAQQQLPPNRAARRYARARASVLATAAAAAVARAAATPAATARAGAMAARASTRPAASARHAASSGSSSKQTGRGHSCGNDDKGNI